MLPEAYSAVMQARSREEFRDEIVRFARALGFETVSAMTVIDHGLGNSEFIVVDNTPQAYLDTFSDPGMRPRSRHAALPRQSGAHHLDPRDLRRCRGAGRVWEQQAQFGYCNGIALALHLPEGRHFVLGVDRDKPLPRDAGELQRMVADLQLFAVHAQESALRLFLPEQMRPRSPALTPRELEALRWTMEGKTAWEVGAILGISERTAVLHVNNAMHKLGCVNKHQAVLKALRLGLIH
jgi:DNA-binding CsgD family transcriptional regulator